MQFENIVNATEATELMSRCADRLERSHAGDQVALPLPLTLTLIPTLTLTLIPTLTLTLVPPLTLTLAHVVMRRPAGALARRRPG